MRNRGLLAEHKTYFCRRNTYCDDDIFGDGDDDYDDDDDDDEDDDDDDDDDDEEDEWCGVANAVKTTLRMIIIMTLYAHTSDKEKTKQNDLIRRNSTFQLVTLRLVVHTIV